MTTAAYFTTVPPVLSVAATLARTAPPSHLADGARAVCKLLPQLDAQLLAGWFADEDVVVQPRDAHVCLGQDHLNQVDGRGKEGPVLIHLLQLTLVTLRGPAHSTQGRERKGTGSNKQRLGVSAARPQSVTRQLQLLTMLLPAAVGCCRCGPVHHPPHG